MENVYKFSLYSHFLSVTKNDCLDRTIYWWKGFNALVCHLMIRTNYRCVQSLNISVDVAKCVENFHQFPLYPRFLSVTKNDLSWLNHLFMARFKLIRMSSYVKNKLLMCSGTQHQCRHRRICGKVSQNNSTSTLTFCLLQEITWLEWTIYSWRVFNSLECPLMKRTN